jgi:hypothetical protein
MRLVIEKPAEGPIAISIETAPKIAAGVLSSGVRRQRGTFGVQETQGALEDV